MRLIQTIRKGFVVAALCVAVAGPAGAFDDPEDMPEGEGREDTFFACVACHNMQVVTRQGMTRPMWEDTITLMIERHGMFEPDAAEREVILNYLTEHFPPVQRPGQRGFVNPFAVQ
jgi:hypothetical protein